VIALASVIDTDALFKVILYSFVAAVGVTAVFSVGLVGLARFDDRRRAGAGPGGLGWAALAFVCALIVIAAVVEAIVVMTSK
jgi:hypothetical protein